MAAHVAYIQLMPVSTMTGNVLNKNTATHGEMMNTSTQPRVIMDANIPNTAGNPSIKDYIEAEDAGGFTLRHLDNYVIITSNT